MAQDAQVDDAQDSMESAAPARGPHGPWRWVIQIGAASMTVLSLLWTLDVPSYLGIALYQEQFLATLLAIALGLAFLNFRASRRAAGAVPWNDVAFAVLVTGACLYSAVEFGRLLLDVPDRTVEMQILSLVILVGVMEALRRTAGWALFIIVLAFMFYALVGHLVPAPLTGRKIDFDFVSIYLVFDTSALLGVGLQTSATVVLIFSRRGARLVLPGGGVFFPALAWAGGGRRRGGAAKIAVVGSALFGSISGSAVSNVVTTGVITIPLMRRSGYNPVTAGAIESVASTGGQFMPPIMGAAAFLMAEFLEISYTDVVVAAVVPALLYYFAVFVQVDLVAAREKIAFAGIDAPPSWQVLKDGWHFVVPFGVLIYALFELNMEPELAALLAAATIAIGGSLRSYRGHRLTLSGFFSSFSEAGVTVVELIAIVAAAGFVIGILNSSGGGFALTLVLVQLGGGNLWLLLAIGAVVCIVLGMGMPTVAVYVLLAALVAPSLVEAGVTPLAAHMFILYFGMMSMITPPIALSAFAAATLTRADPMATGWAAMRLGWVAYIIPFLFVLSPTLLFIGEGPQIAWNIATATAGVFFVAVAAERHFAGPLPGWVRVALVAAGVAAMLPDRAVGAGGLLDAAGIVAGSFILFWRYRIRADRPG